MNPSDLQYRSHVRVQTPPPRHIWMSNYFLTKIDLWPFKKLRCLCWHESRSQNVIRSPSFRCQKSFCLVWTELILRELTQQRIEQHMKVQKYCKCFPVVKKKESLNLSILVRVSKTTWGKSKHASSSTVIWPVTRLRCVVASSPKQGGWLGVAEFVWDARVLVTLGNS